MSIGKQIETIVEDMTGNNIPPEIVSIKKAYTAHICDILTNNGILRKIRCNGVAIPETKGLLFYNEGNPNSPYVILLENDIDVSNYYTKDEIDSKFYNKDYIDGNFYNKSYVDLSFYNKTEIDLNYYNKTQIDSNHYTKTEIDSNHYNKTQIDSNYYTKTEVSSNYYNKAEVDSKTSVQAIVDIVYPIGSIYISINQINPATIFGGEWVQIKDRFLLASGDTYDIGDIDGEATHTLTVDEMPSHTHVQNEHNHSQNSHSHRLNNSAIVYNSSVSGQIPNGTAKKYTTNSGNDVGTDGKTATNNPATATNQNTGGGLAHNNMPPYLAVNIWQRTG